MNIHEQITCDLLNKQQQQQQQSKQTKSRELIKNFFFKVKTKKKQLSISYQKKGVCVLCAMIIHRSYHHRCYRYS